MSAKTKDSSESLLWGIKHKTCRKFTAEKKIRIVLEGLKGKKAYWICVRDKAFIPRCITGGAKSFWRQARGSWLVILSKKPALEVPEGKIQLCRWVT